MRSPVHGMIWYAQLRSSPHVQVKLPPVKNAVSARGPRALGWQWGEMLGLIWIAWYCHPRIWCHFRNCTPHEFLSCQLAIMGTSLYNYSHFLNESPENICGFPVAMLDDPTCNMLVPQMHRRCSQPWRASTRPIRRGALGAWNYCISALPGPLNASLLRGMI